MSNKNQDVKKVIRDWSSASVPKKVVRATQGNIDLTPYIAKCDSMNGLSVSEAGKMYYGENYTGSDSQRKFVRHNICRKAWVGGDGLTSCGINNSGDKIYFRVPNEEVDAWKSRMQKEDHTITIKS